MKHQNTFFLQLTRELWQEPFSDLSVSAKWLFVTLNELEQRFTGKDEDFFFSTNEDLSMYSGLHVNTIKKLKRELKEKGLIDYWQGHFVVKATGKKSEKHVTMYRILK